VSNMEGLQFFSLVCLLKPICKKTNRYGDYANLLGGGVQLLRCLHCRRHRQHHRSTPHAAMRHHPRLRDAAMLLVPRSIDPRPPSAMPHPVLGSVLLFLRSKSQAPIASPVTMTFC